MKRYSLLPSWEPLVLKYENPTGHIELRPQRPCRAEYLFIDGIVDGLLVSTIDVGVERAFESWGNVPARIFELRGLGATVADAAGMIERGDVLRVDVNTEASWPLALDLPAFGVGWVVRVAFDARHVAPVHLQCGLRIYIAFACTRDAK